MKIIIEFNENKPQQVIEECERILACMYKLKRQKFFKTATQQHVEQRLKDFNIKIVEL